MKIVYSYFVLDIYHKGHLLMMKNSKSIAGVDGKLIVGIVSDEAVLKQKGRKPILSMSERIEIAQSIRYVDVVVEQTEYLPFDNVRNLRPSILMESESHDQISINKSRELMKEIGGEVIVMPYYKNQSSTAIKNKIKNS